MAQFDLTVNVECYAGYRGEETPKRFWLGKQCVEIENVVDRWLSPAHRYFKVLTDDNAQYVLRHDVLANRWELTQFQRYPEDRRLT